MSSEGQEDEVTCSICQDFLRDPRCLPCRHTFCRRCLTGHVLASQRRGHSEGSFLCPLCNSTVTPPDTHQHRFFWARQFPNHRPPSLKGTTTAVKENGREPDGGGGDTCPRHAPSDGSAWCLYHDVSACEECSTTLHKSCSPGVLDIRKAVAHRKQEVSDMRTHLDTLRDSFQRELDRLVSVESRLAAERRTVLAELDDFFDSAVGALADRKAELRARVQSDHEERAEEVESKRAAWLGMVEEVEETRLVAEVMYTQVEGQEVLAQFSPLKQQLDHLRYMIPVVGAVQVGRLRLRGTDACLHSLHSVAVEEEKVVEEAEEEPSPTPTPTPTEQRDTFPTCPPPVPDTAHSSSSPAGGDTSLQTDRPAAGGGGGGGGGCLRDSTSSPPVSPSAYSSATRDRRLDTWHKLRRPRGQVTSDTYTAPAPRQSAKGPQPSEVLLLTAALDTDTEGYGLGDICLLPSRQVLMVAYLNSPSLRLFHLPSGHASLAKHKQPSSKSLSPPVSPSRPLASDNNVQPVVCQLTHSPCCLALLTDDTVAATSSTTPHLTLIRVPAGSASVSGSGARAWRVLDMGRQYRAVARAGQRSLALATYHGGQADNVIDVVQFDAQLREFQTLRTVSSNTVSSRAMGVPLFRAPHSLWVQKGGNLVISDGDTPAVVGLGRHGNLRFLYKPDNEELLDSPAGIVGNAAGDLYVTDACTKSVLRLSADGRPQGLVIGPDSGLQSPVALALAPSGPLYVADFYGTIHVFLLV